MMPQSTVSGGTCRKWKCPETLATPNVIFFIVPAEVPGNAEIRIDLVGISNPRTTRPTDSFHIITYIEDGKSEIDKGYD